MTGGTIPNVGGGNEDRKVPCGTRTPGNFSELVSRKPRSGRSQNFVKIPKNFANKSKVRTLVGMKACSLTIEEWRVLIGGLRCSRPLREAGRTVQYRGSSVGAADVPPRLENVPCESHRVVKSPTMSPNAQGI